MQTLSQNEAANKLGVPQTTYRKYLMTVRSYKVVIGVTPEIFDKTAKHFAFEGYPKAIAYMAAKEGGLYQDWQNCLNHIERIKKEIKHAT